MKLQRSRINAAVVLGLGLSSAGCDTFALEVTEQETPAVPPTHGQFYVLEWPDTLRFGDSALAKVVVQDEAGRAVPAIYEWEIDPVVIAGLHLAGGWGERRVLAFRTGQASLRVRATTSVASSGGSEGATGYTIVWADSTRPVVVVAR